MKSAIVLACLVVGLAARPVTGQQVEGRYRLVICAGDPCTIADSAKAVSTGYLTLFADSLILDRLPEDVRTYYQRRGIFLLAMSPRSMNACFELRRQMKAVNDIEMYAGIIPNGGTTWRVVDGQLNVTVYASPDAFFRLKGELRDGHSKGVGWHYDCCGKGTLNFMRFIAERVGPARLDDCRSA